MALIVAVEQRRALDHTQQISAGLKTLPLDATFDDVAPKLAQLAAAVERMMSTDDGTQSQIWAQRKQWMLEELISHISERLQLVSADEFWHSVVQLLLIGCSSSRSTVDALTARCTAHEATIDELRSKMRDLESVDRDQTGRAEASASELMELRTSLVVAQQELQRQSASCRDAVAASQRSALECKNLREEINSVRNEMQQQRAENERLNKVSAHVMTKNQEYTAQSALLASANEELTAHNKVLSVNLESSARVIEKLIDLNEDAMNRFNQISAARMLPAKTPAEGTIAEPTVAPSSEAQEASQRGFSGPVQAAPPQQSAPLVAAPREPRRLADALALYMEDELTSPAKASSLVNPSGVDAQHVTSVTSTSTPLNSNVSANRGGWFFGGLFGRSHNLKVGSTGDANPVPDVDASDKV